jgi:trehalose-6-phosphate synthase
MFYNNVLQVHPEGENNLKITLRIIISILLASGLVSFAFSIDQVRSERKLMLGELEKRAALLGESLQSSVEQIFEAGSTKMLKPLARKFEKRGNLDGVAVFGSTGELIEASENVSPSEAPVRDLVSASLLENRTGSGFVEVNGRKKYIYSLPLSSRENASLGALVLFYDMPYIDSKLRQILYYNLVRFLMLSLILAFTTVLVVRWSVTGPIAQVSDWLKELRIGKSKQPSSIPRGDILGPLTAEINNLAKSLSLAKALSQEKAAMRDKRKAGWSAERLKEKVVSELGKKNLFVVSNREPYMHRKRGSEIECIVPAGGLVTALDPVLRACGGVWIAQGSGDADAESSDEKGRLMVPPSSPSYTLRRVFLEKGEDEGFYYGFSNEGLWPLCHIAHTRPSFRLEDWVQYQRVNEKFSQVLLEETENEESPVVLIQDYHFALLPLLIKSRRPDARVGIFWHIPWPNPEVFGICPWGEEILLGLLGADLIAFHTQFHCNNFLDTVDRFLESKIDWEHFSVERNRHLSHVKPFPISVAPFAPKEAGPLPELKQKLLKGLGIKAELVGIGVDRLDYTKGILERFRAIERFFEKYPEYLGRFTFIELGAPSRTLLKKYRDVITEAEEMAERINWRFKGRDWKPIIFLKDHHDHEKIYSFYRIADLCMVTSLHDGMNLVAKEYVSAREDESGALILSKFTGASRELQDALIVNPYDIEEMAEAVRAALGMESAEKTRRMRSLRETVTEKNVFHWAANLISALARLRISEKGGYDDRN